MILCIGAVLNAESLARIHAILREAVFEDGGTTAGWSARLVKNNLQLPASSEAHRVVVQIALQAIAEHEVVQAAALPLALRPPLVSRYEAGMGYGPHVDDAVMGSPPLRTDLAYTLFVSAPGDCEGGELVLEDAEADRSYKLEAGAMVLYPATTLHRVASVRAGARVAIVGWIQSLCADPRQREVLFDLYRVRKALFEESGKSTEFDLLSKTYSNLLRLFAST